MSSMLALTRLHFQFSGGSFYKGAAGWSETYFQNVPDYSTAATELTSLSNARLATLCSDCQLIGGTISDTAVKGDSFPSGLTTKVGTYTATPAPTSYQPDMALRTLWKAGAVKRGSRWIHCIPTDSVNGSGQFVASVGFLTVLQNYLLLVETVAQLATKIPGAVAPPFYTLSPYTSFQAVAMDSRKLGRPFSLRRGRLVIA